MHWIDRATQGIAPRWTLRRIKARAAADVMVRHYEAAAHGRRTQGWKRFNGDVNAAMAPGLAKVRDVTRDLVRNNPYARSAVGLLVDQIVGWGIAGSPDKTAPDRERAAAVWKAWAGTTACDSEGRHDFAGIQSLVARTVIQDGEVLVRRRWRRMSDGLPIPMQLQVLEADYLDTMQDGTVLPNGNRIIQGVEFNPIGRRVAYWLFREHPGAMLSGQTGFGASDRIDAADVVHVFHAERAGQVRAISWLASVVLKMKDFDEYDDAQLMKQKIAACLAVITSDVDGTAPALGKKDGDDGELDELYPGMVLNAAPGRSVTVVDPPTIGEYSEFSQAQLRAIATGIGITYEDLVGDYTNLPFSAARMSRLRQWCRVEGWRWKMIVPQLCDPVWGWAMQAAAIMGLVETSPSATWTAPPLAMIEPDKEGLAYQRNIRTGIMTLSESIRERGYDPDKLLAEMADDNKKLDRLGLILDSDARTTTQAGQPRLMPLAELAERIDALGGLIRAGFEPEAASKAVGLGEITHTGLAPVTVQPERGTKPGPVAPAAPVPAGANGHAKP